VNCDPSELLPIDPPDDMKDEHLTQPCLVQPHLDLTFPHVFSDFKFTHSQFKAYLELMREWNHRILPPRDGIILPNHQLLGLPDIIQNRMELECQLASNGVSCGDSEGDTSEEAKKLAAGAADWRLLLQIVTDEDGPGWIWGDSGTIYFWIKRQDLKSLRFDDVWLILQCT
jgi:uncharacterized protein YwqG